MHDSPVPITVTHCKKSGELFELSKPFEGKNAYFRARMKGYDWNVFYICGYISNACM